MHDRRRWGWSIFKYREYSKAWETVTEMARSLLLPNILWIILLNSASIGVNIACQMTGGVILLLPPYSWPQDNMGLITIPLLIAALLSYGISGTGGDWLASKLTKRNNGIREPEHQLVNMILPVFATVAALIWFGDIGDHPQKYHWIWFFVANTFLNFGFLSINSVASVYSIECYPSMAG
jgi:hypothetical protein